MGGVGSNPFFTWVVGATALLTIVHTPQNKVVEQ
jgi:hypothetical protein